VLFYSWADVIGYEAFLDEVEDAGVREETRRKTVDLFRLVDRGGCRHRALVRYFDETIDPCGGSCDVCRGEGVEALVATVATARAGARVLAEPAAGATERRGARHRREAPGATDERGAAGERGATREPGVADPALFERLRAVRRRIADAEGVPAYIVFSDATLRHMAERAPRSRAELLLVPGVGPVKLERYGDAFLAALAEDPR
jgi:ATP-dependent DNA helicase RecQ